MLGSRDVTRNVVIGTMPTKQIDTGQLCMQDGWNCLKDGWEGWTGHPLTLDQERERSVGCFEEQQLDEVMVFVVNWIFV